MREQRKQAIADLSVKHAREMSDLMEGGLGAAREKFKELALLKLEWIGNEGLAKEWEEAGGKQDDLPFFSEMALYSLLGKDNARTVLAYLRSLGEALGFSAMEMHRDFKEDEGDKSDEYPTQDDLDALEVMLRDDADYMFREPGKQIVKLQRALGLMREMVGAHPFGHGVEYARAYPKDLKIGDRISQHGRWVDVLGFFDENRNPSETPVPDKLKDDDRETIRKVEGKIRRFKEPYWGAHVKTSENDTYGWAVRSQDQYIVQRQVHDKETK